MTAPSFTVDAIEQALEQGLAVITLMQLRDALQSGEVAILTKEAQHQPLVNIRNRVKAIRDTAILPDRERPRDFNIGWQLGRLIDDIENSAGLRSSTLDDMINGDPQNEARTLLQLPVKAGAP